MWKENTTKAYLRNKSKSVKEAKPVGADLNLQVFWPRSPEPHIMYQLQKLHKEEVNTDKTHNLVCKALEEK